jgi:hypothetical protein
MLVVMETKEAGRRGGLRRKERLSKERLTEIGRMKQLNVPVCRAVWAEQREAHRLAGALLDSLRALIVVEVRLGEARGDGR